MYADSVDRLFTAAREAGIAFTPQASPGEAGQALVTRLFDAATVAAIRAHGYPNGMEVPSVAEYTHIYPLPEIEARQEGYRTIAGTPEIEQRWDQDRWVIADTSADPVTVAEGAGIAYAIHGQGAWDHIPLCDDLATFFDILAVWIRFYVIDNAKDIFDDDDEVTDEHRATLSGLLDAIDGLEDTDAAMAFLLGE